MTTIRAPTVITLLILISCCHFQSVTSFNVQLDASVSSSFGGVKPKSPFSYHSHDYRQYTINTYNNINRHSISSGSTRRSYKLQMGLFDFLLSREDDFIKLDESSTYGPGPIILLYNAPDGILDEEFQDMIDDGMMTAKGTNIGNNKKVKFKRLSPSALKSMGDITVKEVLEGALLDDETSSDNEKFKSSSTIPILYFSGISNEQMLQTYNIIAREIYEESGGMLNAACAKAVEPAMNKSFKQLIEEISGDHADAMKMNDTTS